MLTAEQKAIRANRVAGSEIAAVLGLSSWASPIDVWRSKVEGFELEETPAMKRGRHMEPGVAAWYAEQTGATLEACSTMVHPRSQFVCATPDRMVTLGGSRKTLECKTANAYALKEWGIPGTDDVPRQYLLQVHAEIICADVGEGDIAVPDFEDKLRVYPVTRDLEMENIILEASERFIKDYVLTKKPPPVDGSERYKEYLSVRYPRPQNHCIPAPEGSAKWVAQRASAKAAEKANKLVLDEAENHLRGIIGDTEGIEGSFGRLTYKLTIGKPALDLKAMMAEYKVPDTAIEQFTRRNPYRQFHFAPSKLFKP